MNGVALERLRTRIREKGLAVRSLRLQTVARSCVVILSSSLEPVREWFHYWFPLPPEPQGLRQVYAWVRDPADLEGLLQAAFDPQTEARLTLKGFRLLDTANQVFFLGDLTDETLDGRLSEAASRISNFNLFRTGIFVLHRIENGNLRKPIHTEACLEWARQQNLDRLFLVGAQSPRGNLLSRSEDLIALIGQLLYVLMYLPLWFADQPGGIQAFTEWMGRSRPAEGQCSTWTACSLVVPIDWLLTHILVRKGGQVLQRATLGDFSRDRLEISFDGLVTASSLTTRDTFRQALLQDPSLVDPFHPPGVPDPLAWDIRNPEAFLTAADALDAALPGYADRNAQVLESRADRLLENFRLSLLETVDEAVASCLGGLGMAQTLLHRLLDHIHDLISAPLTQSSYSDVQPLLQALRDEIQGGPRAESLASRSAILGALCLLGVLHLRDFWSLTLWGLLLIALLGMAGALIAWHAWKHRVETLVLRVQRALWDKWQVLMLAKAERTIARILPAYQDAVDEVRRALRQTSERVHALVKWTAQFSVPLDGESAFWVYVLQTPQDVERYVERVSLDLDQAASDLLGRDSPLRLWKRAGLPATEKPNPWEQFLLEKAAEAVFSHMQELGRISVCEVINDMSADRRQDFCELVVRSTDPFLRLHPGCPWPDYKKAFLEVSSHCGDFRQLLRNRLQGQFPRDSNLQDRDLPPESFRLSLFIIVDGINLQDVVWE